jgi:predicted type IV restriction endonuclease
MSLQKPSLENFRETVRAIANGIYDIWNLPNLNEAAVRQVIVLRILQAAGFDVWNPLEIIPEEFSSGGGRIDLVIKIDGEARFVIELKKLSAVLADKETVQTINYASEKAIRWAIATNGRAWKFFDTHLVQKEAIDRGVLEIELLADKVDVFADDLFGLLVRQVWVDQTFEKSLEKVKIELEKRNEHEKIIREKTPLLESFMQEYTVANRIKAINLMVELGKLSKLQSEVLLGNIDTLPTVGLKPKKEVIQPKFIETPATRSKVHPQEISFDEIEEYVTKFANQSSGNEFFWLDQKLSSSSSANIYSCLAEIALKHNIQLKLVTEGERKIGESGKMLRYILLSNGLYLFMNLSAENIRSELQTLLEKLKVKAKTLRIIYNNQEFLLP